MAETLAAKMKQMKDLGYEVRALKAADPTTSATAGDERYVVVPYTLEMKAPGGKADRPVVPAGHLVRQGQDVDLR